MEIIQDIDKIHPGISNPDLNSNQTVATKLFKMLVDNPTGNKLACNQVGIIDHRVAVVNIREPLYLVNPIIISQELPIPYISDDLSFPQKLINTQKYAKIVVNSDNFKKPITFGISENNAEETKITDPNIMEACAIQHVVDMLNGITMYDRVLEIKKPIVRSNKYYRNDMVTLEKSNEQSIKIKFKHSAKYLQEGWTIK